MSNHEVSPEGIIAQWRAVPRIILGRVVADSRETLLEFVETPLKAAVGELYDKNIETLGSSCNLVDLVRGFASITINYETLSQANRDILSAYPNHEISDIPEVNMRVVGLLFPIGQQESPDEVSRRALHVAERFVLQPFSWVEKRSIESVVEDIFERSGNSLSVEEAVALALSEGFYFDVSTRTLFESEEQYRKWIAAQGIDIQEA